MYSNANLFQQYLLLAYLHFIKRPTNILYIMCTCIYVRYTHIIYLRYMAVTAAAMFVRKLTKHPIRLRHSPTRLLPTDRPPVRRKGRWRLPLRKQKQRLCRPYTYIRYIYILHKHYRVHTTTRQVPRARVHFIFSFYIGLLAHYSFLPADKRSAHIKRLSLYSTAYNVV